ncbi:MAG: winged helix-turn-helix domain-containing protein [Terracidiphilus sp.]
MSLATNDLLSFEGFELDVSKRTFTRNGQRVALYPKAFEVLVYLASNPRRVVTKEELMKAVWPDSFVEEGNLAQQISGLRKALADKADLIVTVPARGYQFAASVERAAPESSLDRVPASGLVMQRVRESTQIVTEELVPARIGKARRSISVWLAWSLTAAVLLGVIGYSGWKRFAPQPQLRKVEVGDFLNLTGDSSMEATLKSALTIGLSQTPYIQLMSDGLVQTTLGDMQKSADTALLGATALEVCKRGDYQVLLRPNIETAAYGYAISLEAQNCTTDRVLADLKGQALNKDAILDTLDGLARRTRVELGEPNASLDRFNVPLIEATTYSFEALKDLNIGSALGNASKLKECIEYFQKAVDIDPKFAMAEASLGTAYYNLGSMNTAAAYYTKAFALSANVSLWEKFYIRSNYYLMATRDLDAAAKNFAEWTRVYPADEAAWQGLCNAETQIGNFPRAIEAGDRALKEGPNRFELGYQILSEAYMRANRFADAKRTIADAQAQGKDAPELHRMLYQIAAIERDPETLRREAQWAQGKPEYGAMLESEAIAAADQGKYRLFEETMASAITQSAREVDADNADAILRDEASVETQLGRTAKAAELLKHVKNKSDYAYAVIAVRAGDPAAGEAFLRQKEANPADTIQHFLLLPELRALVDLRLNNATAAIAALEPARQFELARPEVIEVRAQAYLAAGEADQAALEFQKLIANPALEDPTQPRTIVADAGLARAYAMEHKIAESRAEYRTFLTLWRDADPDAPIYRQARRELAGLQ